MDEFSVILFCLVCCGWWHTVFLHHVHYLSGAAGLRVSPEPRSVRAGCLWWVVSYFFFFFALSRWHSLHNMPYSLMGSQLNTLCHLHRCIHCLHYATRVTIHACRLTLTPFSHTTQKYIMRAAGRDISHIKFKKQNKKSFRSTDLNFFTVKEKRWKICLRVKTELKTGTPLRSFSLQTSGTTCRSTCGVCV